MANEAPELRVAFRAPAQTVEDAPISAWNGGPMHAANPKRVFGERFLAFALAERSAASGNFACDAHSADAGIAAQLFYRLSGALALPEVFDKYRIDESLYRRVVAPSAFLYETRLSHVVDAAWRNV